MNIHRKQIIISEIKYWKKSKLLPEHYCDFLITLYAQGENDEKVLKAPDSVIIAEKKKLNRKMIFIALLSLLTGASLFVFIQYPVMILAITGFVIILLLFSTFRKSIARAYIHFVYIISSFLLLAMTLKVWLLFFEGHTKLLLILLMLNCVLWLVVGRRLKILYFTISGIAGLILGIIFFFFTL